MMHDELVKRLRETSCGAEDTLWWQAADAIAEMQKCLDGVEADNDSLCATIDELKRDLKQSKEYEAFWEQEANEALKKFQTTVARIQRWIPVEERLPEEPGEYTVFIKDPFYKREDEDFISFDGSYVSNAFYDKDAGLWHEDETNFYCANLSCVNTEKTFYITHWMPLPEPPKEE